MQPYEMSNLELKGMTYVARLPITGSGRRLLTVPEITVHSYHGDCCVESKSAPINERYRSHTIAC